MQSIRENSRLLQLSTKCNSHEKFSEKLIFQIGVHQASLILCCLAHMVSWVGSGVELCQFWRFFLLTFQYTVELQWLEHLWDHENMFETEVVRANDC